MSVTFGNRKINFQTKSYQAAIFVKMMMVKLIHFTLSKMSPANMIRKFGIENVDDKVIKAYDGNQDIKFKEVLHAIEPQNK